MSPQRFLLPLLALLGAACGATEGRGDYFADDRYALQVELVPQGQAVRVALEFGPCSVAQQIRFVAGAIPRAQLGTLRDCLPQALVEQAAASVSAELKQLSGLERKLAELELEILRAAPPTFATTSDGLDGVGTSPSRP